MGRRAHIYATWWWAALALIAGFLFSNSVCSFAKKGDKIDLLSPYIIGLKYDDCPMHKKVCNITVRTRANNYTLRNFELEYVPPDERIANLFEDGEFKKPDLLSPPQQVDEVHPVDGNLKMCQSYARVAYIELCVRETLIFLKYINAPLPGIAYYLTEHRLPLTAIAARPLSDPVDNSQRIEFMFTDSSANLFVYEILFFDSSTGVPAKIAKKSLSRITWPNLYEGVKEANDTLLENIVNKLTDNLDERFRGAYVQAITPIFPDDNKETDDIPLCLKGGLLFEEKIGLSCWYKGVDQTPFMPTLHLESPASTLINSLHLGNHNGSAFIHMVFLPVSQQKSDLQGIFRYLYCTFPKPLKQGQLFGIPLVIDSSLDPSKIAKCQRAMLAVAPSDIIGFEDPNGCKRIVVFYDRQYSTYPPDEVISFKKEYQTLSEFPPHRINAIFSWKNKIYFFVNHNDLMIYEAKMSSDCEQLTLVKDSLQTMFSQEFLLPRIRRSNDIKLGEPYIYDYRQRVVGAKDTYPPLDGKTVEVPTVEQNKTVGDNKNKTGVTESDKRSSSGVVIIAVGLILGGLIVAAIVYLFCLRDNREPVVMARPKSAKKIRSPVMDSSIKTVRSSAKDQPLSTSQPKSMAISKSKVPMDKSKQMSSVKTPKDSRVITLPRSPRSSSKTPSSPKSIKSPKSLKSPLSAKSNKSMKSPKSVSKVKMSKSQKTLAPKSLPKSPKPSTKA